jgi:hypothetical protein
MKTHAPFVFFAVCIGCGGPGIVTHPAAASSAQSRSSADAPLPPATFEVAGIDEYIMRRMAARGFVGLSVAIVKDGAIVLDKGYGQSQLAAATVATSCSRCWSDPGPIRTTIPGRRASSIAASSARTRTLLHTRFDITSG